MKCYVLTIKCNDRLYERFIVYDMEMALDLADHITEEHEDLICLMEVGREKKTDYGFTEISFRC